MSGCEMGGNSEIGDESLKLNRGIFFVWRENPHSAGVDKTAVGNAFAIGPDVCLTAHHVVKNVPPQKLYLHGGDRVAPQRIIEVKAHPTRDIALLYIDPAYKFQQYFALSPQPLENYFHSGESVLSCGYVNHSASVQRFDATVCQFNADVSAFGLQGNIQGGRSGGCLLNRQMQVLGVVYADSAKGKNHFAIALDSVRPWLQQAGVWRQTGPTPQPPPATGPATNRKAGELHDRSAKATATASGKMFPRFSPKTLCLFSTEKRAEQKFC